MSDTGDMGDMDYVADIGDMGEIGDMYDIGDIVGMGYNSWFNKFWLVLTDLGNCLLMLFNLC